jgi:hypothetical protein
VHHSYVPGDCIWWIMEATHGMNCIRFVAPMVNVQRASYVRRMTYSLRFSLKIQAGFCIM